MLKAEKRLQAILKRAENSGVPTDKLTKLEITKKLCKKSDFKIWQFLLISSLIGLVYFFQLLNTNECFLEIPFETSKIFRKPEDCNICVNVTQIDKITEISPEDFDQIYSAKAKPVVIKDGTKGWEALDLFDFDFFKELYKSIDEKREGKSDCQFFPYKTEFTSLSEVFNMTPERAKFESGTKHWYIGWSNCNDEAGKILRKYYREPYFLPKTSENMALNWIFMGGPGSGAHMHVDDVLYPSWQAQLKGRKIWYLAPPPECLYKCKSFEVTVEPGEIIVVDTNRWYHQTHIIPGSISITIGSEFD